MNKNLRHLILMLTFSTSESSILTDAASSVANEAFAHRVTTSVIWREADVTSVAEFLKGFQGSVKTVGIDTQEENRTISFVQAVLFITSPEEFQDFVAKLDQDVVNPSKVITLFTNFFNDSINLNLITKTAWENDIADIIIMLMDSNDTKEALQIYTYFPYTNEKNCGNTDPVKLELDSNLFPRKFKNFHGCQIRLCTVNFKPYHILTRLHNNTNHTASSLGGIWGDMFKLVLEPLNANLYIDWLELEMKYINKKWTGIMKHLIEKKSDFHGSVMIDHRVYSSAQLTPIHHFYEIIWCGPPQREIYAWAKVIFPLFSNITAIFCGSFIAFVLVLRIIHRLEPGTNKKKHPRIIWKALAILLGQEAKYVTESLLLNVMFALWIWVCLVVNIVYQGELVRGLQTKLLEPRFRTLENAIKRVDDYGGTVLMYKFYNGTPIEDKFKLLNITQLLSILPEVARGKRMLLISDKLVMYRYTNLQFLDNAVRYIPMSGIARPRWAAAPELSALVSRIVESGFFTKIHRDFIGEVRKNDNMNEPISEGWDRLDFVTMSTCFYGLTMIWLVCIIIFSMELFYEWFLYTANKRYFQA